MRLLKLIMWVQMVLGPAALSHAAGVSKSSCDHERSRTSRTVLQQHVLSMAAKAKYQLSEQCPLHPLRDMYDIQHSARHRHHGVQWKCGFCDKLFRTETFLDQHMDNNHQNETHPGGNVCLADWCEVLHCDYFAGKPETHHFFHHHTAPCRPKAKMKLKQQCQDLAQRCFPPDVSKEGTLMYDYFTEHFCGAHTCIQKDRQARLQTVDQLGSQHRVWGHRILVGLLMLFMAMLYAGIWLYLQYYVRPSHADIRSNRQSHWWSPLVRKNKAY
ncbi:hypothetical protein ABBQ32_011577 [Trebouxia sp. C0010 RCD-2024]